VLRDACASALIIIIIMTTTTTTTSGYVYNIILCIRLVVVRNRYCTPPRLSGNPEAATGSLAAATATDAADCGRRGGGFLGIPFQTVTRPARAKSSSSDARVIFFFPPSRPPSLIFFLDPRQLFCRNRLLEHAQGGRGREIGKG